MKFLLSLLFLVSHCCIAVSAQTASLDQSQNKQPDAFIRENEARRAKNPEGLIFTVKVKDNQKRFQFGEMITLELSFASSKPETFTLDAGTYDRSGRMFSDGFAIDKRDAAVDPLADYFSSGLDFFMIGGLRGIPDLTDKPHLISADLNEWQRIDKPGHYRLYVVSSRVGRKGGGRGVFIENGRSPVVSNVIEFEVLPADKKWARQKLNEIVATLSKPGDHRSACRALRFLGTTAAVPEMRKRFNGDDDKCEWQYKFGLIGSPHRDLVIREMENAISLGEQPITSHFISTLALLEFTKRAEAVPPYPAGNEEQVNQWQAQTERRRRVYTDLRLHYLRQLVSAIPQKQRKARATSLQTLLDNRSELNTSDFSQWSTLLASLPEVFSQLPFKEQLRLLQYQWKPIASGAMLPVLRELFKYSHNNQNEDLEAVIDSVERENLRSIALRRLYGLSPEEGRHLIIQEISRLKPRITQDVLLSLPDETLPELNTVLLSNFEESRRKQNWHTSVIGELIERYATDEILSRMRAIYETQHAGRWECRTQAAFLGYFLRVAPSLGGEYLKAALAAREADHSRCYRDVLKTVAEMHMSAELEDAATAALDDEDSKIVSQAASVLGQYGSADAEKVLWQRLEGNKDESVEEALRNALSKGQGWLLDPEKLKRLRELCVTEKGRKEVDQLISNWTYDIYVNPDPFDDEKYSIAIAQYQLKSLDSLKQKLLQFPKGTIFKWVKGDAQEFQQIKTYLEEHGMKLEREPEKTPQ